MLDYSEDKMNISDKLEDVKEKYKIMLLNSNISIYKIITYYVGDLKTCMVFVFFDSEKTLNSFSEQKLKELENIFINLLQKEALMPAIIDNISGFYFDSDENVQKKYNGNYFYATL